MDTIPDYQKLVDELGPQFRERAAAADEGDRFVAENFAELKARGLVAAGVPDELGGGGRSHAELGDVLRQIAQHCGSTALAFSMHTHQVATNAWRWRHQKAPVDGLLRLREGTQRVFTGKVCARYGRRLNSLPGTLGDAISIVAS